MQSIVYSFENLNAWQEAKRLVEDVYHLPDNFPQTEKYALCDQMRRTISFIPSIIAEGCGCRSLR